MARGYPPHVVDEEIAKVDYDSVQHETLHMEVKLPDCALCNAQAATHPNPIAPNLNLDHHVETHKAACFDPESEGDSRSKTKKKEGHPLIKILCLYLIVHKYHLQILAM